MWLPKEIFIQKSVAHDPVVQNILTLASATKNPPVVYHVSTGNAEEIKKSSALLNSGQKLLSQVLTGKDIVYVGPVGPNDVDEFEMPDPRMNCPTFARIKHASNGCHFKCDWCFLKLTYRSARPYITIKAEHYVLKKQAANYIKRHKAPVIFNSGELADSLALEHLSMFGQDFIPWFGQQQNGYLFMLTKSDQVDRILGLNHNGHTKLSWSLNEPDVSRRFEIGAPPFVKRLKAAFKAQQAGYPIRIRIDPVIPFDGWKDAYAHMIKRAFRVLTPEKITLGTLRFEDGFYKQRNSIFQTGDAIRQYVERMQLMFPPSQVVTKSKTKMSEGKYSFPEQERIDIFRFIIAEIRRYSSAPIALCKEATAVWAAVGLNASLNQCLCQL